MRLVELNKRGSVIIDKDFREISKGHDHVKFEKVLYKVHESDLTQDDFDSYLSSAISRVKDDLIELRHENKYYSIVLMKRK